MIQPALAERLANTLPHMKLPQNMLTLSQTQSPHISVDTYLTFEDRCHKAQSTGVLTTGRLGPTGTDRYGLCPDAPSCLRALNRFSMGIQPSKVKTS